MRIGSRMDGSLSAMHSTIDGSAKRFSEIGRASARRSRMVKAAAPAVSLNISRRESGFVSRALGWSDLFMCSSVVRECAGWRRRTTAGVIRKSAAQGRNSTVLAGAAAKAAQNVDFFRGFFPKPVDQFVRAELCSAGRALSHVGIKAQRIGDGGRI